ncbi:hypothetical protein SLEP1_g14921 [Rubroshorea leprosula]|uniref:AAA+ ATPase domain-containing protein n=1 Tax=Rubroshorea leprosula TaxID=152421 RepID=A0AAV5IW54_9ROSI|nr:hypothetical protein SLEP1_g14921 [Rubroshorea leprosula]
MAEQMAEKMAESIASAVVENIADPISVVRKCNENVQNLKNQVEALENKIRSVEDSRAFVHRRGEDIFEEVQTWLNKADEFIKRARESIGVGDELAGSESFFRLWPNPLGRYDLSKKAAQIAGDIANHVQEAPRFDYPFSHAPPPQQDVAAVVEGFEEFPSRMAVLEQIMKAVRNPIVNTIGVHGTSGVGKTFLVKMVKGKAKQDSLFTAVVMAKVTKNPDLKSIQHDIARDLGMDQLPTELPPQQVADRIKAKLIKKKKFLVILDDVWEAEIDLKKVGIPSASELKQAMEKRNEERSSGQEEMLRKILLTSRDPNVLSGMMDEKDQVFKVHELEDDEAWHLFKKIAGSKVESSDLQPTAKEIVKKCLGLPVAIASVGKAMKGKTRQHEWKTALGELKRPNPEGISAAVYKPIELSYKYLQEDELKQTFMLCSLLGHDSSINDLLKYGMGLNLFRKVKTVEETRDKVLTLVHNLKRSSLLVDGHSNMHFGMHDQIREVALSIASRDHGVLALADEDEGKNWPEKETMEKLKWIYLSNTDPELTRNGLKCPRLTFFHLSNKGRSLEVPTDLFTETEGLKVLCLTKIDFQSMPSQIPLIPTNLKTLLLDQSVLRVEELGNIMGNLEKLEVLSLAGCDIEELPREMEKLTKLKLLDVSDCTKLKVIPQQVLARLSKLEELKMGNSFDQWGDVEGGNARLAELTELRTLTALEVRIPNFRETLFPENLERFKIFIGIVSRMPWMPGWVYCWDSNSWNSSFENSNIMKLKLQGAGIKSNNSVKKLLKKTEELYLEGLNGVESLLEELDDEGFQHLKCLHVQDAPDIRHIFNPAGRLLPSQVFPILEVLTLPNLQKMEKICHGLTGAAPFKVLRKITVVRCDQLKNLFSFSMARQLPLQEITVEECNNIEEIIDDVEEQGNGNDIVEESEGCKLGGSLRSLTLRRLPKLISFFNSGNCSGISLFNDKFLFPNLDELQLLRIKVDMIWIASYCVENLTKLIIRGCDNLKYLFSSTMARSLVKLGHLEIEECKMMTKVLSKENEEEKGNLIFPGLKFLQLLQLQNLVSFYFGDSTIEFSSLNKLIVSGCPKLKGFAVMSTNTDVAVGIQPFFNEQVDIPLLDDLFLSSICVQKIWHSQITLMTSFVQNLRKLTLWYCNNLKYLFTSSMVKSLGQLEVLKIWGCKEMQVVILIEELVEKEKTSQAMFPKLDNLKLYNLPQLIRFCSNCNSLGEVYEAQGHNGSGSQVVAATQSNLVETEVTQFVFPQVTYLELSHLPNFKGFFPQMYITKWPLLKRMLVQQCDKVKTFASEFLSIEITYGDNQLERQTQDPMFWIRKDSFPCLEQLKFKYNSMKEIWRGQYPVVYFPKLKDIELLQSQNCSALLPSFNFFFQTLPSLEKLDVSEASFHEIFQCERLHSEGRPVGYFGFESLKLFEFSELIQIWKRNSEELALPFKKIQSLEVNNCSSLSYLLTPSMVMRLEQLKNLKVKDSAAIGQVIMATRVGEVVESDSILFPQLKSISLEFCSKLSSFYVGSKTLKFPMLEEITVMDCLKMVRFTSKFSSEQEKETTDGRSEELLVKKELNIFIEAFFCDEVEFPNLNLLKLSSINISQIWNKNHEAISSFKKLQHLEICNCSSLSYLLTPSMVLRFGQLKDLKVKDCAAIEQVIIATRVGEVVESDSILFPQLESISLESCSELSSFYVGSKILKFPMLEEIIVKECLKMARFTSKFSSEQEKETTDGRSEEMLVKKERNIFVEPFFCDKLDSLVLQELPKLTRFCSGNFFEFPSLTKLTISKCSMLKTFISGFAIGNTTINTENEVNAAPSLFCEKVKFPNLNFLELSSLNMNQIWNKNHEEISSFKKLQHVEVCNCSSLSYLLTPSMALDLVQLKDLMIKDCETMEQVIMAAGVKEVVETGLIFPQLNNILLESCSKLSSFHAGSDTLKFPMLKKITVKNCLKRVRFASKFPSDKETEIANGRSEEVHVKEEPDFFIEAFFCDEVEIPNLETLILSSINTKQIWNNQLSSISSFAQNLTKLKVVNCSNLKYLFTFSMVKNFAQLKELGISGCEMMEVVILIEGTMEEDKMCQAVFPKLETLTLNDLPQLATFCSNCDSLGKFSDSERVNFDTVSQKLLATQSTLVETEATKLVFSQVTKLLLRLLPKFNSFFPQMHITEWPSLKSLVVIECHGVQIVASEFSSTEMTHGDSQLERESQHLMFWMSKVRTIKSKRLHFLV